MVCQGFKGGEYKDLPLEGGLGGAGAGGLKDPNMVLTARNRFAVPFLACGDLNGVDMAEEEFLDADRSYDVDEGAEGLKPVQAPIDLPHQKALRVKEK